MPVGYAGEMEEFRVHLSDDLLVDLNRRLTETRYPEQIAGSGFDYGMDLSALRSLVDYWRDDYDWRAREERFNRYPQYKTTASGEGLHFYHVPSAHPGALPIVLLHGYMGSVVEFLEMIGPLSDPPAHGGDARDAFHVVVPSLPGHGFSGPIEQRGFDMHRCADAIAELMEQLGYSRYIVQGGDWGALVTRRMGEAYADRLIAVHFNMLFAQPPPGESPDMSGVTEEEQARMASALARVAGGTGYMSILSTKPQTISMAHNDSPAGMAAWLLEKYQDWCDLDEADLGSVFTQDQLIDNVMFYWATAATNSSARLYYESARKGTSALDPWEGHVRVPTGHAVYPCELLQTPRCWADERYNIVHWSVQSRGGHFAPFEQPGLFTQDLREFGRLFR